MVAVARSGINFTDPREFDRNIIASGSLTTRDSANTQTTAAVAGFFTEMAKRGLNDDTNHTAATYKTLLSISSGVGYVSTLIGPTGLAGTPTTTFEVTVDGVLTEVAVVATTTGQRAVLGPYLCNDTYYTNATAAYADGPSSLSADKTTSRDVGNVLPWSTIRAFGAPCLVFRTSLLIRVKSSESNSTTTNQERQCAIQYKVMG